MTRMERMDAAVAPLLRWYRENARQLPWRRGVSAYGVWVSEIMLQQTRVEVVKERFSRFMAELPDARSLAEVSDERLHKLWEGLGYYARARNMKRAAAQMVERFGGEVPQTREQLLSLPGVGAYTAGAVCAIAFGLPCPAVDGNVLRVLARLNADRGDISRPEAKKKAEQLLAPVIPPESAGDFTQALMELGALVCIPNGAPLCASCPLAGLCEAKRRGTQEKLPVKAPKKRRRVERWTVLAVLSGGRLALEKRPDQGLLAGLWGLPMLPGHNSVKEAEEYLEEAGLRVLAIEPLGSAKHVFTHVEWHMIGWAVRAEESGGFNWACAEELRAQYAVPSAFRAYLAVQEKEPG